MFLTRWLRENYDELCLQLFISHVTCVNDLLKFISTKHVFQIINISKQGTNQYQYNTLQNIFILEYYGKLDIMIFIEQSPLRAKECS